MALPKIKHPLYDFEILSLGKKIKLRPFTVKEEKIILLANTSDDVDDKLNAILQIVNNCITSETIEVENLPSFEIERLFLKLRSISVGSKVEVQWVDPKDSRKYPFEMDLDHVELDGFKKDMNIIEIGDGIGVVLRYPPLKDIPAIYTKFQEFEENGTGFNEIVDRFLHGYLDKVFDDDKVYVRGDDFNEDEIKEFVENLNTDHAQRILDFFVNIPTTVYKTNVLKKDNTTEEVSIRGILNFLA